MREEPNANEHFAFFGLDPRKAKRSMIERLIKPLGEAAWTRFPPMRLTSYPETAARAKSAHEAARRPARNFVMAWLQKRLYALQYNGTRNWFTRHPEQIAVAWNGLNGSRRVFMDAARDAGARTLYFELAPFKGKITCDPIGVNQANSLPRTPDFYLDWIQSAGLPPEAWRDHRTNILQRTSTRDKPSDPGHAETTGPYLFAPLQVPGDSQLRLFGGHFRTVPDFIDALVNAAEYLPTGWHLKIKEHPTAEISFADHIAGRTARVVLDNRTDTFALVAASSGVVTVNSSVGLESMFFDKPVVACGQCFWAIRGAAETAPDQASLDAVFARPESLTFDPKVRGAFLSFLLNDYYVPLDGGELAQKIIRHRLRLERWS